MSTRFVAPAWDYGVFAAGVIGLALSVRSASVGGLWVAAAGAVVVLQVRLTRADRFRAALRALAPTQWIGTVGSKMNSLLTMMLVMWALMASAMLLLAPR
ncbi:MAG: hypothetical protein U0228_00565 [Myxococcaceae bacterium]